MNKAAKKITGALLAGALGAAFLTGCSSPMDGTQPLLTSGEDTVTVGTGNLMLRMNQATMLSYYSMMGGSTTGLWSQDSGDGETYGDTTKASILDELENMLVQKLHAADYDVSISEEEQGKIEEAAQAFMDANTEETIQNLSVSQSDVETLLELYTYQTKMYDPMVADVDTNVEDSEAAQSRITYCRIDISDTQNEDGTTTPLTDEEKQEKKDQAQALLDKLQASADPASADMDAFAKEVNEDLNAVDNTFGDDDTLLVPQKFDYPEITAVVLNASFAFPSLVHEIEVSQFRNTERLALFGYAEGTQVDCLGALYSQVGEGGHAACYTFDFPLVPSDGNVFVEKFKALFVVN